MNYEVGKVYCFNGENRLVTGHDGMGRPITEAAPEDAKVDYVGGTDYRPMVEFIPLDKCTTEQLFGIIKLLGIAIEPKEDGKDYTNAEYRAIIIGA